jgi:hypothetical protein
MFAQADGRLVVAGGHDGIEALYSTEVLMVESNGEFASEWCAQPRSSASHQRTNAVPLDCSVRLIVQHFSRCWCQAHQD